MKNILFRLKEYKYMAFLSIFFLFLQTGADLLLPTFLAAIIDKGVVPGDVDYIIKTGLTMLLIAGLGGIATVISAYFAAKASLGFSKSLRKDVFKKASEFSLKEINEFGTASLITRTTNDVVQVQNFVISSLRIFVRAPIMAIGGITLALSMDPSLSMILVLVVLILVAVIITITRRTSKLYRSLQTKIDQLNLLLRERLIGIRVLRAFNREEDHMGKYDETNQDLMVTAIRINRIMAIMMPMMMLLMNFSAVAILWFGAWRVEKDLLLVGNLLAFIQYASLILFSFVMMTMLFVNFPRAQVSAQRVNEILTKEISIKDKEDALEIDKIERIVFKDLSFSYFDQGGPALKDINLTIERGSKIGIIGGTGSGKTTLINLIPRFYDPSKGSIEINGHNLKDIKLSSLREKIGYVPQESFVMSGSIAENIRFGIKKEVLPSRQIIEQVQLTDFVDNLPKGMEEKLYQAGRNISGGQKQRINIGRALALDPDLLIFDDSFSALDYKTDYLIRKEIKEMSQDKIIIMVAQRVTTVMDADKIVLLDAGGIEAIGSHKELLASNKIYREIVSSQLSEEELA